MTAARTLFKPAQLLGFLTLVGVLALLPRAAAHPMGFGMADIRLGDGTLRAELVLDAPPEAAEKREPKELAAYKALLQRQLSDGLVFRFDDKPVKTKVKVLSVGDGPAAVDIARVTAPLPKQAKALVIDVGAEVGDLGVEIRGGPLARNLRGLLPKGQASAPVDLTPAGDNSAWAVAPAKSANPGPGKAKSRSSDGDSAATGEATRLTAPDFGFVAMARLGFRHILPDGVDHVLFILGLLLLNSRRPGAFRWLRRLGLQLTLFTVSHSITLALGALGYVDVPASVIEPLIALSIVYVGVEPLLPQRVQTEAKSGPIGWLRGAAVVFAFGLLHGLGFASALATKGFSQETLVSSLFAFNVGVELGQLAVALAGAALVFRLRRSGHYFRFVVAPASLIIAGLGLVWFFERTF